MFEISLPNSFKDSSNCRVVVKGSSCFSFSLDSNPPLSCFKLPGLRKWDRDPKLRVGFFLSSVMLYILVVAAFVEFWPLPTKLDLVSRGSRHSDNAYGKSLPATEIWYN